MRYPRAAQPGDRPCQGDLDFPFLSRASFPPVWRTGVEIKGGEWGLVPCPTGASEFWS